MLKHGIIKKSESAYGTNVVLVKKKNGTYRFAVDYRELNKQVKPIVFPTITLDDVVDCLSEATPKVFSSLDLRQGFWQIKLHSDSMEKTTFIVSSGAYCFTRMPFGTLNATAAFNSLMYSVLAGGFYVILRCATSMTP